MQRVSDRLAALGIKLPAPPRPVAAYVPAVRTGDLIYVSGQIPFVDGKVIAVGPVPSTVSIEEARLAARQCALNGLAILAGQLGGDLDRVRQIVRLGVFVCSDPGFTDQPKVANGASDLLVEVFSDPSKPGDDPANFRGRHARAAVGSIALPLGATVEVEMIAEISN